MKARNLLLIALLMSVCLMSQTVVGQQAQFWLSQPDRELMLVQQASLNFGTDTTVTANTITVNPNSKYQEMDGFGASLTGWWLSSLNC